MSIGKRVVVGGALLLTLSLVAPDAWAQFASTLEGTVTDPSGGVVPAATVTITNEATGVTPHGHRRPRPATTDSPPCPAASTP